MDSRHQSLPAGTTSSEPPRPWARMETARWTSMLTDLAGACRVSNPRSEVRRSGQSGRRADRSSMILTSSPCRTATFTNFSDSSPRLCLTTRRPGATTSRTRQETGRLRVASPRRRTGAVAPDAEVNAGTLHGGREAGERLGGDGRGRSNMRGRRTALRRHEGERDARHVAFLAPEAGPEGRFDHGLDGGSVGDGRGGFVATQQGGGEVAREVRMDPAGSRPGGGIGGGHHRAAPGRLCAGVGGMGILILQATMHAAQTKTGGNLGNLSFCPICSIVWLLGEIRPWQSAGATVAAIGFAAAAAHYFAYRSRAFLFAQREAKFRLLFENNPLAMWVYRPADAALPGGQRCGGGALRLLTG